MLISVDAFVGTSNTDFKVKCAQLWVNIRIAHTSIQTSGLSATHAVGESMTHMFTILTFNVSEYILQDMQQKTLL